MFLSASQACRMRALPQVQSSQLRQQQSVEECSQQCRLQNESATTNARKCSNGDIQNRKFLFEMRCRDATICHCTLIFVSATLDFAVANSGDKEFAQSASFATCSNEPAMKSKVQRQTSSKQRQHACESKKTALSLHANKAIFLPCDSDTMSATTLQLHSCCTLIWRRSCYAIATTFLRQPINCTFAAL